jgi:hypothetical protein
MPLVLNGDGAIAGLAAGGLPDASVTQSELASNIASNGPAFSAYMSTNQTIATSAFVKVQLNAENFDTNNNFDSTTNYRFTPTVAGYYQINAGTRTGAAGDLLCAIYKNGSIWARGTYIGVSSYNTCAATLVYLNGSSDYIELYHYSGNSAIIYGIQSETWMSGMLVRTA